MQIRKKKKTTTKIHAVLLNTAPFLPPCLYIFNWMLQEKYSYIRKSQSLFFLLHTQTTANFGSSYMMRCLQHTEAKRTGNTPAITDDVVGRSLRTVYVLQWSLVLPNLNIFPIIKIWAHGISAIHLSNLWLCQLQLTWYEIHNEDNEKLFLEQTLGISGGQLFSDNYTKCSAP